MGKGPTPPDPVKTAEAQTGLNIGTAVANGVLGQVNQVTPNGNLTYETTGFEEWTDPVSGQTYQLPRTTATQTLSAAGQEIQQNTDAAQINLARMANQQSGALGEHLGEKLDFAGLPGVQRRTFDRTFHPGGQTRNFKGRTDVQKGRIGEAGDITRTYGTDFSRDRGRVENALMSRMQPGLEQDRKALEDRLASQGIGIGSEAYHAAFGDYGRQTNDARMAAILAGGQEQSRMVGLEANRAAFENAAQAQKFGERVTRAGFRNDAKQSNFENAISAQGFNNRAQQQRYDQNMRRTAFGNTVAQQRLDQDMMRRQQAIQERTTLRNQPINEISALLGGSQVTAPNFMNISGPQAATTDYAGLVNANYGQQMQGYAANQQMLGGLLGGFGSMIPGFF